MHTWLHQPQTCSLPALPWLSVPLPRRTGRTVPGILHVAGSICDSWSRLLNWLSWDLVVLIKHASRHDSESICKGSKWQHPIGLGQVGGYQILSEGPSLSCLLSLCFPDAQRWITLFLVIVSSGPHGAPEPKEATNHSLKRLSLWASLFLTCFSRVFCHSDEKTNLLSFQLHTHTHTIHVSTRNTGSMFWLPRTQSPDYGCMQSLPAEYHGGCCENKRQVITFIRPDERW